MSKVLIPYICIRLLHRVGDAERGIKGAKNFDEIDQGVITSLIEILLLVFGDIPQRGSMEKFINRQEHWKFDGHRSLYFVQCENQKINVLHSVAESCLVGENMIFEIWTDYILFFSVDCENQRFLFLDWLRDNHPSEFYEVLKLIGA